MLESSCAGEPFAAAAVERFSEEARAVPDNRSGALSTSEDPTRFSPRDDCGMAMRRFVGFLRAGAGASSDGSLAGFEGAEAAERADRAASVEAEDASFGEAPALFEPSVPPDATAAWPGRRLCTFEEPYEREARASSRAPLGGFAIAADFRELD